MQYENEGVNNLTKLRNKNGCQCPTLACKLNYNGLCCSECEKKGKCPEACLNSPDICERYNVGKGHAEIGKYTKKDENGIEWVMVDRAIRIMDKMSRELKGEK